MLEKNQKKTAKQQRSNKASLPRLMGKWCAYIYFSAVKSSIPCSNLFFYTFHGHLSWFWLNDPNMTFCTARSVFATVCFNQVLTATKTEGLLILKNSSPLPFPFLLHYIGFAWPGFAGGGLQEWHLCEAASVSNRSHLIQVAPRQTHCWPRPSPSGMVEQPLGFEEEEEEEENLLNKLWLEREVRREEAVLQTPRSVENEGPWSSPAAHGGSHSGAWCLNVTLLVDAWNKAVGSWAQPPLPLPLCCWWGGGRENYEWSWAWEKGLWWVIKPFPQVKSVLPVSDLSLFLYWPLSVFQLRRGMIDQLPWASVVSPLHLERYLKMSNPVWH